jgi:hypothetical protein
VAIGTFDEFMALSVADVLTMTTKSTQSIFSPLQASAREVAMKLIEEQTLGSVKLPAADRDSPLFHLRGSQEFIILSGKGARRPHVGADHPAPRASRRTLPRSRRNSQSV